MQESDVTNELHSIASRLRIDHAVECPEETLVQFLQGFIQGRNWVLRKFRYTQKPQMWLGPHEGMHVGLVKQNGRNIIGIHTDLFGPLETIDPHTGVVRLDWGSEVPGEAYVTAEQLGALEGIEETTHWLQAKRTPGLKRLPPVDKHIPPTGKLTRVYHAQPHELEALILQGEYFQKRYGENPFLPVISSLQGGVC